MASKGSRRAVQPGEPAPDFEVSAVHHEGTVSLADYRGKRPLFLALYRGLYCPFCRRHVVQLQTTAEKLRSVGVETFSRRRTARGRTSGASWYMATVAAIKYNPVIRAFFHRLVNAGRPGKVAVIAAMRKLLTILNAMLRDRRPWQIA
jgi:hypothetical protein